MKSYYLYVVPFLEGSMFKVGISSSQEYARIRVLNQQFKIDPKTTMLVMAEKREVRRLESMILSYFSEYSMSKKVIEVYGLVYGHREVLNIECLGKVKDFIYSQRDLEPKFKVIEGVEIPGIYGYDQYLLNNSLPENRDRPLLICRDLLQHLCDLLATKQVSKLNVGIKRGIKNKVQIIRYVVMAEKGFSNDLFDGKFRIFDGFVYGDLEVRHYLNTGCKLQSGATFISGEISLADAEDWDTYEKADYVEDVSNLDMLLNYLNIHVQRDMNYKVFYMNDSGRTEQYADFYPYQPWREIKIGKSLSSSLIR